MRRNYKANHSVFYCGDLDYVTL